MSVVAGSTGCPRSNRSGGVLLVQVVMGSVSALMSALASSSAPGQVHCGVWRGVIETGLTEQDARALVGEHLRTH